MWFDNAFVGAGRAINGLVLVEGTTFVAGEARGLGRPAGWERVQVRGGQG